MRSAGALRKDEGGDEREPLVPWPSPVVPRKSFWRRNRWIFWLAGALAAVLVGLSVVLAMLARRAEPFLRAQIVEGLEQRFHTKVELDSFHVAVRHGGQWEFGVWATGRGLRIWPPNSDGGTERRPLIALEEFSFHVPLRRYEAGKAVRIPEVRLKGLEVHVPPRSERSGATGAQPQVQAGAGSGPGALGRVLVERVVCEQALVVLETDQPDKLPLVFRVARLKLKDVQAGQPVNFDAELTNAKPTGEIESQGSFGPWVMTDPGASPVKGKYVFRRANLGEFNGIGGILSSNGTYGGTLREIGVDGETMTPDFKLTQFGTALPLHTRFHARVDGTNGDTYLDSVEATLGNSRFTTAGKVVRVKLEGAGGTDLGLTDATGAGQNAHPGHVIDMKVDVPRGNMADFMRLVSKNGTPMITGAVEAKATLHIPPGQEPVNQRMKLEGVFKLDGARFTNEKFQDKVEDLSYRGQGRPDAMKFADAKSVAWQMQGSFKMAEGVIALPDLKYSVPGAEIDLAGTYALEGAVHFDGTARMDATASQMVGGWKGFLLKPADRYFKKDGAGTLAPITVRGSREQPEFGLELRKMNATHPERPGEKP